MTTQAQQIYEVLPFLPKADQKELLVYLANLVVEEVEDFRLSPAWEAELDRRESLLEKGETKFFSLKEILSEHGL